VKPKSDLPSELPLAVEIASVVEDAAPEFDDLDVDAEAKRLAKRHPEAGATEETIAEVLEEQIEAEKQPDDLRLTDPVDSQGSASVQPDDIIVRGDDEGGWFFHHPDHGQSERLPTMQMALRRAVELGQEHELGVSVQLVDGTEKRYWAVGEPLPESPDE
jgi:hypothetical protein